jgi:hypothetical protein
MNGHSQKHGLVAAHRQTDLHECFKRAYDSRIQPNSKKSKETLIIGPQMLHKGIFIFKKYLKNIFSLN